jgi:acyl phosphate:glycerol-3-phosphate acyltransferase
MNTMLVVACAAASYLIGSLSFARLVTRLWSRQDVTQFEIPVLGTEDHYKVLSIGANSVSSGLGPLAGMTVSVLDILKIILPVLFCKLYFDGQPVYMLIAAIAGLAGHVWPVFYRFHGGSGFSAILGGLLVIDPLAILVCTLSGLLLGMLVLRNLVVASLGWLWLLIPWIWWHSNGDPLYIGYAVLVNVLFILAMVPEIQKALQYKREGKTLEYGLGSLSSNPMGRGMLRMARAIGFMKSDLP